MKKNISINLQGMIFHIEEDGYDVLSRYLAEVKAHFSGYRGHEEIVADIEGRIAELFAARLSPLKQVITLDDVESMTAKMGRVSDFQPADEADEDEQLLAEAVANGSARGTYAGPTGGGSTTADFPPVADEAEAETGPKRLYRDMANRKIAGVAAGIARYFAVNPLWIRLGFVALLLIKPLVRGAFDFDGDAFHVRGFDFGGFAFLVYVVLWIALPKRYDATPADEDPTFKKLYRDTDNGKVGGVSAGLAAYFKVDVVLVRILFLVGLFAGGFAFPLYIVLWILLPEAKTASDKLRMRGSAVTLSALDSDLRNNPYAAGSEGSAPNNRPVGTFLEDSFSNIRPVLNGLGGVIRAVVGGILVLTGFSMLLPIIIGLGVGLGLTSAPNWGDFGPLQPYLLFNDISVWAVLAFFLLIGIPALALLLTGLGLLLRRSVMSRAGNLTLLGLWLLGIVGSAIAATQVGREFRRESEVTQTVALAGLTSPRLLLERRQLDNDQWVDLDMIGIDSAQAPRLERIISAKGSSDSLARRMAATSTAHNLRVLNDSTLRIDDHFTYQPNARLRDQHMRLRLLMPRGRTFRMTEDFANWLDAEDYVGGRQPYKPENAVYRMQGSKLECLNCTDADLRGSNADNDDDNSSDYDEGRSDANINLDLGGVDSFDTAESGYGSGRRSYSDSDFDHVSVAGPYRLVVRPGSSYSIKAAGSDEALRQLVVKRDGNELVIKPRNRSVFRLGSFSSEASRVLITMELPVLNQLELVGGARARVSGFSTGDLQVEQAGGSQLTLDGKFNELNMDLAGGCRAALRGSADQLSIDGAGACEVIAPGFTARRANIDVVGASKVRLRVTEELEADATGASVVEYSGSPADVRRSAVGASSVRAVTE
ncbi:PspC domain-containing protein [Hymenobacter psychrophilus]|uniref:Phage shock protein C (PspC) family protein n=1 Tax=Hymenobacter psychrophilus TaxID=651662 RepID=A0A1H3AVT0_9BACT|nr:PspC domain-containing protein [Hymenobacter psychrophilus]SDX33777.1 phage shock protein C (PspC) family protein [Hymenobacter psychrophilus]